MFLLLKSTVNPMPCMSAMQSVSAEHLSSTISASALLLPGIVFGIVFSLNLVFWFYGSSAAIPFLTLLSLLCLWLGVSVPLNFLDKQTLVYSLTPTVSCCYLCVGGMIGFRQSEISFPVRVNKIPRVLPHQTFFSKFVFGTLVGGGLPFGCIFLQMFFILKSIWGHATYYMFGFLFIVFRCCYSSAVSTQSYWPTYISAQRTTTGSGVPSLTPVRYE